MGPGAGRAPSSGSGPGPGLASAPDRATHLVAARLGNALLELGARDLGPARARRQEVRGGKRKRRPNSMVLSASATLPEPNRPASRSLTSARSLRRSGERRLTLCRAVVARRRRAKPRWSGRAAHRASFPIAFSTDSILVRTLAATLASRSVAPSWRHHVGHHVSPRSVRLAPLQRRCAKGACIFRLGGAGSSWARSSPGGRPARTPARTPRCPALSAQEPPSRTRRAGATRAR